MMTGIEDIVIIIPAYNAGATVGDVLGKILEFIPARQVVVVDDGSSDNTGTVAKKYGVQLIRHGKNRGKGAALKSGFQTALTTSQMRAAITMDADGQHAPGHVPEFIHSFRKTAADLIIGCRELRYPPMPLFRVASNRITSKLISWRVGLKILDSQSGYRLHSRQLLEQISLHTNGYEMETELLLKAIQAGMKIKFISIPTIYLGQQSHIRGLRDTWRFVKMLIKL
jgi:glycosyltransferase involved in cell wall biosynthesis